MKTKITLSLSIIIVSYIQIFLVNNKCFAQQGVAINMNGALPDNSAMLDKSS